MTALPTLKARVKVDFPAQVVGAGGINVSKSNGVWTIEPDFSDLATIAAAAVTDPSLKEVWIFDPITEEYNVLTLAALGDALYKLTSTTSLSIGSGSKVFTTQANKDIAVGSWVLVTSDANPTTNYMPGQVTAYSGTSLTINVPSGTYGGSGTHTDWTIRAASVVGSTGATGATGPGYAATSTTSLATAGSGSKAFTTQSGLAYSAGARIRATSAGTSEWMEGVVSTYSGTTLTVTMDKNSGTGTHADWNINLAGQPGAGDLISTNNGSDFANYLTVLTNLHVEGGTGHGDSIYSIVATDKFVYTSATFTASRTWTLPAANAVNAGHTVVVCDLQATVTATNTLVISRAGSDTITVNGSSGQTSATLDTAGMAAICISDGSSKWFVKRIVPFGTSAGQAIRLDSSAKLPAVDGSALTGLAASQAQMEAASSNVVYATPGRVQNHPGVAKAWVNYTEITTTAISVSYNVTSLTDNGTGDTTINFTTAFSSANYAISAFAGNPSTSAAFMIPISAGKAAGSLRIGSYSTGVSLTDFPECNVEVFGDQ